MTPLSRRPRVVIALAVLALGMFWAIWRLHGSFLAEAPGYTVCRDAMRALAVGLPIGQARQIVVRAAAAIPPGDTWQAEFLRSEAEESTEWEFHCERYATSALFQSRDPEDSRERPALQQWAINGVRATLADNFDYLSIHVTFADGQISAIVPSGCNRIYSDSTRCTILAPDLSEATPVVVDLTGSAMVPATLPPATAATPATASPPTTATSTGPPPMPGAHLTAAALAASELDLDTPVPPKDTIALATLVGSSRQQSPLYSLTRGDGPLRWTTRIRQVAEPTRLYENDLTLLKGGSGPRLVSIVDDSLVEFDLSTPDAPVRVPTDLIGEHGSSDPGGADTWTINMDPPTPTPLPTATPRIVTGPDGQRYLVPATVAPLIISDGFCATPYKLDLTRIGDSWFDVCCGPCKGGSYPITATKDRVYVGWRFGMNVFADGSRWPVTNVPGAEGPVIAHGDTAFVGGESFVVVDVGDAAKAHEVARFNKVRAWAMALDGSTVYLMSEDRELLAIDVTDPANPQRISATPLTQVFVSDGDMPYCDCATANALAADGAGHLFALRGSILRVLDVSHPERPTEIGHYVLPGAPLDIAALPGTAYVSSTDGIWVLTSSEPTPTHTP